MSDQNLTVIKLENHKVPEMKEHKGTQWVTYGEKNDYPQYLLDLFNRSGKHNAIITGKVHYIKGNGFVLDENLDPLLADKANRLMKNINSIDTIDDFLYKTATDLEVFGGICIDVIPRIDGSGWAELYHLDKSKIRVNKRTNRVWYSEKWSDGNGYYKPTPERDGLRELKMFDEKTFSGVFIYDQYRPSMGDYPLPEYIGAIPYIQVDTEIANFHLNNLKHGFAAGTLISFNNGEPDTEDKKATIERRLKRKTAGSDNAGEIIIAFSNGKDSAPTIASLTSNNFDKLFDTLNQTAQQEIFAGHKVTSPMLFGIKTEGQLGGSQELSESFELFKNGYVTAKQLVLENILNYFFELNKLGRPLKIQQIEPIKISLSEQTLVQILTKNELREKAGYPMIQEPVVQPDTQPKFSLVKEWSENEVIEIFEKFGNPKSDFLIHQSFDCETKEDALLREINIYKERFDKKDELIPSGKPSDSNINTGITTKIGILYSYELRSDAPALENGSQSRPFCQKMMNLDRLYSRDDIDKMSKIFGYDVFKMRGGFYHNPKLDITTPYCRHIWKQNVVSQNG